MVVGDGGDGSWMSGSSGWWSCLCGSLMSGGDGDGGESGYR